LGKLLGTKPLGVYSLSSELANYPSTELCAPINRALFPGYARLKNKQDELQKTYLDTLGILTLAVLPIGVGMSATAQYVVPIILGDKWTEAIQPLSILAIAFAVTALSSNAGYIYVAVGKPKIGFFTSLLKIAILIPLLLYLTNENGIIGASVSYLIISVIMPLTHFFLVSKLLRMKIWKIVSVQYRPVISVAAMYIVLTLEPCRNFLEAQANVIISITLAMIIGATIYTTLVGLLLVSSKNREHVPEKRLILLVRTILNK
jgi:O-antigen/teichoic acid export membrane protein